MADERRFNNSAAIDLYATQSAAVRLPEEQTHELPQEQVSPQVRRKPKLTIAPFALFGALAAMFLLVMVLLAQVRLYEFKNEESELKDQIEELDTQLQQLRSDYEKKINLRDIEVEARVLGMRKPTQSQTVYLNIAGADSAEVLHYEQKGFFGTLWDAIRDGVHSIAEYFG